MPELDPRELLREATGWALAPVDAIFDMLEQSADALCRQAEALDAAGRALQESAALMRGQAELFARTVGALRQPTALAKSVVGHPAPRKSADGRRRAPA